MNFSLLITTFNCPSALDLVLKTVVLQSRVPDEVVLCDDGSSSETRMLIKEWEGRLPIRHAWQPDSNFRAARCRNLGLAKSNTEYIVWIDGDCLLPTNFLENHLKLSRPGYMVSGGRRLLTESKTQALIDESVPIESAFSHWKFFSVPCTVLRDSRPTAWETVRSCNFSLYRSDLDAVAGFDESFVGWGREDSDLVVRLMHKGVKVRSGRFAACVAHLHHDEQVQHRLSENDARFQSCFNDLTCVYSKSSILARL